MSKEKSDEYWKGYIQKQNESMEICKICRYRTKFKELEDKLADSTPNSVIREKIEELKNIKTQLPVEHMRQAQIRILEEILKEGEK